MNWSISASFDGAQWGNFLQHFDEENTTSDGARGQLKVTEETFQFSILKPGSQEWVTLNLAEIMDATKEILKNCEGNSNAMPLKKGIVCGLKHLENKIKEIVDEKKLRGTGAHGDAMEFYDENTALKEDVEATPESRARKEIFYLASSSKFSTALERVREKTQENFNLLFDLTEYHESFFDMLDAKCPQDLLLPLLRDVLYNLQRVDASYHASFKAFLFHENSPKPTFFESLMAQEDGNQLFDCLMKIITDDELNKEGHKMRQVLSFAYSIRRYEYIFMSEEEILAEDKLAAASCYSKVKLQLGVQTIYERCASKSNYSQWLKARQMGSSTLTMGTEQTASSIRWIKADKKRSEFARTDRGSSFSFSIDRIHELHQILTQGEEGIDNPGKFRTGVVRTSGGWTHLYCPNGLLLENMEHFINWFNSGLQRCEQGTLNPIIFAAQVDQRFVSLHPYENANGRMARLMMDYVAERFEVPPPVLGKDILDGLFPLDSKKSNQEAFLSKIIKGIYKSKETINNDIFL